MMRDWITIEFTIEGPDKGKVLDALLRYAEALEKRYPATSISDFRDMAARGAEGER